MCSGVGGKVLLISWTDEAVGFEADWKALL